MRAPTHRSDEGKSMAGKFELWVDKGGDWRFNLKASNGQVIATSQGYSSKASAVNGIESVKANAPGAEVVEIEK
ncbi:YegP family protein [Microbacterium rhizosphaerae]|uniref:YegP family protein n=1 Tax=Microbacterium rhizosphaerae TaxID=1678237 RepID=A0ABZ0SLY2_9MICO|nr:YegP family protein [Microbacterium rhizosphaerae]WPR89209.1 YegP family protein [Microbacterium rhizosphaerae]